MNRRISFNTIFSIALLCLNQHIHWGLPMNGFFRKFEWILIRVRIFEHVSAIGFLVVEFEHRALVSVS